MCVHDMHVCGMCVACVRGPVHDGVSVYCDVRCAIGKRMVFCLSAILCTVCLSVCDVIFLLCSNPHQVLIRQDKEQWVGPLHLAAGSRYVP